MSNADVEKDWTGATVQPEGLKKLFEEGLLSEQAYAHAVAWLTRPTAQAWNWRVFLEFGSLFLGVALLVVGVIFFFAYNWASLHRFVKLGLVEAGILGAALFAWSQGLDKLVSKASLMLSFLLIGPLFAVFGQIYQTGADAYTLFVGWALLSLGWVFVSRFAASWFLWLLIVNTASWLFFQQTAISSRLGIYSAAFYSFLLNMAALFVWEWLSAKGVDWLSTPGRWAPRVILCIGVFQLSIGVLYVIFGRRNPSLLELSLPAAYLGACVGVVWIYFFKRLDLFMLSSFALSFVVVSSSFVGRVIIDGLGGFFFLSFFVFAEVSFFVYLLRKANTYGNA